MDALSQFQELLKEYADFREIMIEGLAIAEDHPEGEMLFEMAVTLDQTMDSLRREVPAAIEGYKQSAAEMQKEVEETQKEIAEAEKGLEDLQREADAPAPEPPAAEPDWDLATMAAKLTLYRSELLGLLKDGKLAPEAAAGRDSREIWEDWTQFRGD